MSAAAIVSNVVRVLLLPPASLFLLLAIGLLIRRWWPRVGRALSAAAVFILFLLCTEAGADLLVSPLESMTAPLASAEGTHAQAIVVLAAGKLERAPEYGDVDIPDYIALARLRYAARLQHETGLPILVSGGNSRDGIMQSKAGGMARALREDFATPVQWIEGDSENTAENATFSSRILNPNGVRRILLVTDAMHMPRSTLAFAQNGFDVIAAPTMFFSIDTHTPYQFMPSAEGLRRSYYAFYEWLGIVSYRMRYGTRAPRNTSATSLAGTAAISQ